MVRLTALATIFVCVLKFVPTVLSDAGELLGCLR